MCNPPLRSSGGAGMQLRERDLQSSKLPTGARRPWTLVVLHDGWVGWGPPPTDGWLQHQGAGSLQLDKAIWDDPRSDGVG